MAEEEKSLEMRVAELEDKLSGMTISDEEMAAARKVMGGSVSSPSPQLCVVSQCIVHQCIIHQCIINQCIIRTCIIQQCFECSCGPCNIGGGGGLAGGGFGSLGG